MALTESPSSLDQSLMEQFNKQSSVHPDTSPDTTVKPVSRPHISAEQSESDTELANQIRQLFYTSRSYRKPLVGRWNKAYKTLRGRYWNRGARQSWMPSPEPPEIFSVTRSIVGWMTDRRFHHTVSVASAPFTSNSNFFSSLALDLETVLDSTYFVNNEEAEITLSLWDAFTYGTGLLKTTWDDGLAGGMGDAKIRRVDPFGFYIDPNATSLDSANYMIETKQMSLQEIERRFPGSLHLFHGGYVEETDEKPSEYGQGQPDHIVYPLPGAMTPGHTPSYGKATTGPSARNLDDPGLTVFEAWIRDYETYTVEVTDPEAGTRTEEHIFDTWRVVVMAGNRILLNEPATEIWSHGKHPYSRFVPYDLGEFWGISLVDLLASTQETINRLLASAIQNIELTGNPVFVEGTRSGVQRTQITNKPGTRMTEGSPNSVRWMDPPSVQGDIPQFLRYFLERMQVVAGLSDASRGQTPGGRNSSKVQESVQESAFVGIRLALRSLEYTLRDAGNKKASLIIENYTLPRMSAIMGPSGEKSTLALRSRHFLLPSASGNTPMEYSLHVDAGSNSDTSRQVREDKAITLFTLGALDVMSLLEALNVPHREQVLERIQQQAQAGLFNPPGKREKARA